MKTTFIYALQRLLVQTKVNKISQQKYYLPYSYTPNFEHISSPNILQIGTTLLLSWWSRLIISGSAIIILIMLTETQVNAQKIDNKKYWTTYHKSAMVELKPKYTSFSMEYDFGDMVVPAGERPNLQDLEYKKADGDLILKLRVKNVYSSDKEMKQETVRGKPQVYYNVAYKADYGYDLVHKESGASVASYKRTNGFYSTPAFGSITELDMYLKNAFVADLTKYLIQKVIKRVDYDLSPSKYEVRLVANFIEATTPAYQEINKATSDFAASVSTTEPDKEKLKPAVEIWENQLKKANWEDKKSEINKKVANALIENLCAAYLLLEDYPKLVIITNLAESKNKGLLSNLSAPFFEIDDKYPGPCSSYRTVITNGKLVKYNAPQYVEFASDFPIK